MKVKIGNKIYDGEEEPIMIIFEGKDKENIINMVEGCTKYCQAPDSFSTKEIKQFMGLE